MASQVPPGRVSRTYGQVPVRDQRNRVCVHRRSPGRRGRVEAAVAEWQWEHGGALRRERDYLVEVVMAEIVLYVAPRP